MSFNKTLEMELRSFHFHDYVSIKFSLKLIINFERFLNGYIPYLFDWNLIFNMMRAPNPNLASLPLSQNWSSLICLTSLIEFTKRVLPCSAMWVPIFWAKIVNLIMRAALLFYFILFICLRSTVLMIEDLHKIKIIKF